jgi:hypothetical protein
MNGVSPAMYGFQTVHRGARPFHLVIAAGAGSGKTRYGTLSE